MLKNYYKIMGIDILSTIFDIKEAYKRLARKYHPDKSKSSSTEDTFKQVNEAYHVLSKEEKRQKYNERFLSSKCSRERFIHDPPVFNEVQISFEDIYFGAMKRFSITRKVYDVDGYCTTERKEFTLVIKRGMKGGSKFTFPREGDRKPQHIPADIIFVLVEKPHPQFSRSGNDLIYSKAVPFKQLLSDRLDVYTPLLNGRQLRVNMRNCVFVRSQSYRVKGKGLPSSNGIYGDMILFLEVDLPSHIRSVSTKRGAFPFRFFL